MTPRHLLMGAALAGAAALLAFGDNSPDAGVAEPVARTVPAARLAQRAQAPALLAAPLPAQPPAALPGAPLPSGAGAAAAGKGAPHILRLLPRHALIGLDGLDESGEAFGSRDWTPPPPPPPAPVAPPPPPPPSAPPLPFTVIGKARENGVMEVYLARAGRTFIVKPNTVLDGTYRVDAIAPPFLTLTYLPLNQVQQLNIGAFD